MPAGTGLLTNVRWSSNLTAAAAAATSDVNGVVVDMQNFEGVVFQVSFGTAAADNGLKIQQGDLANGSDMDDLLGSKILGNTRLVVGQVHKPAKRYVRCVAIRGTSSTCDAITAVSYGPKTMPVTSSGVTTESNISPAEGTA